MEQNETARETPGLDEGDAKPPAPTTEMVRSAAEYADVIDLQWVMLIAVSVGMLRWFNRRGWLR